MCKQTGQHSHSQMLETNLTNGNGSMVRGLEDHRNSVKRSHLSEWSHESGCKGTAQSLTTMSLRKRQDTSSPVTWVSDEANMPKSLKSAVDFCKTHQADVRPYIYTDDTYDDTEFDLHSFFDATKIWCHAAASVVIVHDGADWKETLELRITITNRDMIYTQSAYTM